MLPPPLIFFMEHFLPGFNGVDAPDQYCDAVNCKRTGNFGFNRDADFTLAFSPRYITPVTVVTFDSF